MADMLTKPAPFLCFAITMATCVFAITMATCVIATQNQEDEIRYTACGGEIPHLLSIVCNSTYQTPRATRSYMPRLDIFIPKRLAARVFRSNYNIRRARIVSECCNKSCTRSEIVGYCSREPVNSVREIIGRFASPTSTQRNVLMPNLITEPNVATSTVPTRTKFPEVVDYLINDTMIPVQKKEVIKDIYFFLGKFRPIRYDFMP